MRLVLVLLALVLANLVSALDFNVLDYGAVADGVTMNTKAFEKTIQAASDALLSTAPSVPGKDAWKNSGIFQGEPRVVIKKYLANRVVVPKGTFLTGTIQLKSRVFLHLEEDAVILGSTDPADYPEELW
jgi:polygalacturonase